MNQIFEKYGKVITSVIGIIIAVGLVISAGALIKLSLDDGVEKMVNSSQSDWTSDDDNIISQPLVLQESHLEEIDKSLTMQQAEIESIKEGISNLKPEFIDKIYPIGAIFTSTNNSDPSVTLGGEWIKLNDTILVASGSSNPVGMETKITTKDESDKNLTIISVNMWQRIG